MSKKNTSLTHGQVVGIVWISVSLLLIAGVAFFYRQQGADAAESSAVDSAFDTIFAKNGNPTERSGGYVRYAPKHHSKAVNQPQQAPLYTTHDAPVRKQRLVVDLNDADTTTLQLLHGIGPAYARRIVAYRERLGGFVSIDQLVEVYGFTDALVEHIRPYVVVDAAGVRPLDVNRATLKELIRHPYIEYYQARDIVRLRDRGVRFASVEDLRAVPSMADSTIARIEPYLCFGTTAAATATAQ